jgi:hypothetical protein
MTTKNRKKKKKKKQEKDRNKHPSLQTKMTPPKKVKRVYFFPHLAVFFFKEQSELVRPVGVVQVGDLA